MTTILPRPTYLPTARESGDRHTVHHSSAAIVGALTGPVVALLASKRPM